MQSQEHLCKRKNICASSEKNIVYEKGLEDVDILNDFIRNFYRDQPAKLAAWKIASHIERSPKKKK